MKKKSIKSKIVRPKVSDLLGALTKRAPLDYAESWDNVGLLAGDADIEVKGVVVSVNLGPEALNAAKSKKANVIVVHHPPIFKPVSKLTRQSTPWLYEAVTRGYAIIALHTNFDLSSREMNEMLSKKLGCNYIEPLAQREGSAPTSITQGKFITYVPEVSLDKVRDALFKVGAGVIGDYSRCSFSWMGAGTFKGGKSSNPAVGKTGQFEKAKEVRLEVVFPWKSIDKVVQAAKKNHPYEEMAFDVIQLKNSSKSIGYGFVADCNLSFNNVLSHVKDAFQLKNVTMVEPPGFDNKKPVKKVAYSPGSGSAFIGSAVAKGVNLYICGEVGYHQMLEARTKGVALLILGHSYSERFYVETVSSWIAASGIKVDKVFEKIDEVV